MSETQIAPPAAGSQSTARDGARAGGQAALVAVAVNVAVFGVGTAADAAWEVEMDGTVADVPLAAVIVLSAVFPVLAGIVRAAAGARWSWVGRAWAPVVVVLGVLSLGGVLGAEDAATRVSLAVMHLVVAAVAAFLVPRRLDR